MVILYDRIKFFYLAVRKMKAFIHQFFMLSLIIAFFLCACSENQQENDTQGFPNIVYILADDLGYGDLTCYNPESKIATGHLDRLAREGMMFTDAHSGSAVCTPTRYGILTGRYAWRSTLKRGVTWSYDPLLIDTKRLTVASLLKTHGYHTACIGKWHLGLDWQQDASGKTDITLPVKNGPNNVGFDYFFGITASLDIPPYVYMENDRATTTSIDTIEAMEGKAFWRRGPIGDDFKHKEVLPKLTEKAVDYIKQRAEGEAPFFLYFPLPAPHTPILPTDEFTGKSGVKAYGDFVLMVDDLVAQIVSALEENGLKENTLIIFTSDNGCAPVAGIKEMNSFGHYPSYIFRGHKADIFEGGHRVPFIANWPAKIKGGAQSDETVCLTDFMATCAGITDSELPDNAGEDSFNLLPVLFRESYEAPLREATVHHSVDGYYAIRQGKWKLLFCPGSGGWSFPKPKEARAEGLPMMQLYDLETDPGEQENLADQHPSIVKNLTELMAKYTREGRSTPGSPRQNEGETPFLPDEVYQRKWQ